MSTSCHRQVEQVWEAFTESTAGNDSQLYFCLATLCCRELSAPSDGMGEKWVDVDEADAGSLTLR